MPFSLGLTDHSLVSWISAMARLSWKCSRGDSSHTCAASHAGHVLELAGCTKARPLGQRFLQPSQQKLNKTQTAAFSTQLTSSTGAELQIIRFWLHLCGKARILEGTTAHRSKELRASETYRVSVVTLCHVLNTVRTQQYAAATSRSGSTLPRSLTSSES